MRDADELAGLAQLHLAHQADELRALWRRGMATLAAALTDLRPVPLEGIDPESLRQSMRVALRSNLLDELDFLAPAAAAVAVFELATALPRSQEKHDLARRVLPALHDGNAETFAALATSLAQASPRGLAGEAVRARVALALYLPIGTIPRVDALALALISRRELQRDWLSAPSTGSLPDRRMAARLLERAARHAAERAAEGDDSGVRVFDTPAVREAADRLLADRESLVWRHVAAARGLLSRAMPSRAEQIESGLAPDLSPTEWRRAAASLMASRAVDPVQADERISALLGSDLVTRDIGIAGAMILGMPCALVADVATAVEFLDRLLQVGGIYAVEALVDVRREVAPSPELLRTAVAARARLHEAYSDDDGMAALVASLHDELAPEISGDDQAVARHLGRALSAFASGGIAATAEPTGAALAAASAALAELERTDLQTALGRRRGFRLLRTLDRELLESPVLGDLLSAAQSEAGSDSSPLGALMERLTSWLLAGERSAASSDDGDHLTWRLRRLRTLLHLVDADGPRGRQGTSSLRKRRRHTLNTLLQRVQRDVSSPARRTIWATLSRVCDAVVREEIFEVSDVLVGIASCTSNAAELEILAEASMAPELKGLVTAYARAARAAEHLTAGASDAAFDQCIDAVLALCHELPPASSPRVEALRSALVRVGYSLRAIRRARGLRDIAGQGDHSPLARLELNAHWLALLISGACWRLGLRHQSPSLSTGVAIRRVEAAVDRAASEEKSDLPAALRVVASVLGSELTPTLAHVISTVLDRLAELPLDGPEALVDDERPSDEPVTAPSASWMPPHRTLGGFYILHPLGKGAGGSVFIACRAEERHHSRPQRFALKVPEYSGEHAHTLSEAEFLRLFREEAGALLALPDHPNLSGFVTFDARAQPKPILVMELVEGPTVERLLDKREVTVSDALRILDGVARGLSAMHAAGVAHLDVKPSNIILRRPSDGLLEGSRGELNPVLVDFGLAGRQVRPGCATVHYGAPEVWSSKLAAASPLPTAADVYAFCCLAFELLTGYPLFDGETAVACIGSHLRHDGMPERLQELGQVGQYRPLVEILHAGLRHKASHRARIDDIRNALAIMGPRYEACSWPLRLDD
jgi:hypothetical protein